MRHFAQFLFGYLIVWSQTNLPDRNFQTGSKNYELNRYESGFYVPSQKLIRHYDVAEFEEATSQAKNATDDEAAAALTHAIDLYRFPFLKDYDHPWIIERRHALHLMYADALVDLGRWHQLREDRLPRSTRTLHKSNRRNATTRGHISKRYANVLEQGST